MAMEKAVLGLLCAAALLAACAGPSRWTHPSLPRDQWSIDQVGCKTSADRLIDRQLARGDGSSGLARSALEKDFEHFDARQRHKEFFARCLRDKGYVKDLPKPGKAA